MADSDYRYDLLSGIFSVLVNNKKGHVWIDSDKTEERLLSVVSLGYIAPVSDMKGNITASSKKYKILKFDTECAKICTTPPEFTLSPQQTYHSEKDDLSKLCWEEVPVHYARRGHYGHVYAHQDEYLITTNQDNGQVGFIRKSLLPQQSKVVALTHADVLLDAITASVVIEHAATLNLYADIHEVIANDLRAKVSGTSTKWSQHQYTLPVVYRRAPLLLNSPIKRVREAAKWLLEHPECADWDYVKDVIPPEEE